MGAKDKMIILDAFSERKNIKTQGIPVYTHNFYV